MAIEWPKDKQLTWAYDSEADKFHIAPEDEPDKAVIIPGEAMAYFLDGLLYLRDDLLESRNGIKQELLIIAGPECGHLEAVLDTLTDGYHCRLCDFISPDEHEALFHGIEHMAMEEVSF